MGRVKWSILIVGVVVALTGVVLLLQASGPQQPAGAQLDGHFGINGLYVAGKVAEVGGLSPSEVFRRVENEKIPEFIELGAGSGRVHPNAFGSFAWNNVDPDKDGVSLDFSMQDNYVILAQRYGISLLPSLSPESEWETSENYVPENIGAYKNYVKQVVERYDGDSVNDMPGLKSGIKYWQLNNEADLHNASNANPNYPNFETPDDYFVVLKATHEAMKEADSSAHLMPNLAGLGQGINALDYLTELIGLGALDYFDVFSYHVYTETYEVSELENFLENVKGLVGDLPIWITETAAPSQQPEQDVFFNASLAGQARWLVKNYVFHLANGVEKVLWLNVWDDSPTLPQKHYGLKTWGNVAKPAYHTFKLMTSKLSGFTSIETLASGQYRFNFSDRDPVYVLWADRDVTVDLTPHVGSVNVLITHIIEQENQTTATTETAPANNITVGKSPMFVEIVK